MGHFGCTCKHFDEIKNECKWARDLGWSPGFLKIPPYFFFQLSYSSQSSFNWGKQPAVPSLALGSFPHYLGQLLRYLSLAISAFFIRSISAENCVQPGGVDLRCYQGHQH
jgi:hypothetical protein